MNSKFYYSIFFTLLLFVGLNSQLEAQITVFNNTACPIYIGAYEGNCSNFCNQNETAIPAGGFAFWPSSLCAGPNSFWIAVRFGVGVVPTFTSYGISYNPFGGGGAVISPFPPGPCGSDQFGICGGNPINVDWTPLITGGSIVEFN